MESKTSFRLGRQDSDTDSAGEGVARIEVADLALVDELGSKHASRKEMEWAVQL